MIKVSIVEDLDTVRQNLSKQIELLPDMRLLASYKNAEDAVIGVIRNKPDVIIMDIGLPGMDGIRGMFHIKEKEKNIRFLMFTVFDEDKQVFEALKVGADGYILKTDSKGRIIKAIREVMEGGAPMSREIAKRVLQSFRIQEKRNSLVETLTTRQLEILHQLSKGYYYKEIGDKLGITEGTVKQHIHQIYKKLQVNNRTEAINSYRNSSLVP